MSQKTLAKVTESGLAELQSFASGVEKDKAAVQAGFTWPVNNGQTEAQVHRLKFIKRQAYGRASFEQLRRRVLHGSGVTHQERLRLEHLSQRKCV